MTQQRCAIVTSVQYPTRGRTPTCMYPPYKLKSLWREPYKQKVEANVFTKPTKGHHSCLVRSNYEYSRGLCQIAPLHQILVQARTSGSQTVKQDCESDNYLYSFGVVFIEFVVGYVKILISCHGCFNTVIQSFLHDSTTSFLIRCKLGSYSQYTLKHLRATAYNCFVGHKNIIVYYLRFYLHMVLGFS